jgi:hypothetical protein
LGPRPKSERLEASLARTGLSLLAPFAGRDVAWSQDGKRLLAHALTIELLYQDIDDQGLANHVVGYIPAEDLSDLGGGVP